MSSKQLPQKTGLLILLILNFSIDGFSQNHKVDSLKLLLRDKSGIECADVAIELARAYSDLSYDDGFYYADTAFQLACKASDTFRIVRSSRIKAQMLRRMDKLDSALEIFNEILPIARRNNFHEENTAILNAIGTAYLNMAQHDKALKFFFESASLSHETNDKFREGVALNNIGLVFYDLKDFDRALTYYKKSLLVDQQVEDLYNKGGDLGGLLINISLSLIYKNNFPEARKYLEQASAVCQEGCSIETIQYLHSTLGTILYKEKDFVRAEHEFLEAYKINKQLKTDKLTLTILRHLLAISIETRKNSQAENYAEKVEALMASGIPYNLEVLQIYPQLFSMYIKSNDLKKAVVSQNRYIVLRDSVYGDELTTNLMKVHAEYLEKENTARLEAQNKILSLNEEIISRQYFINIFVVLVSALLVVVIVLLVKINQRKQIANVLLDKKVQQRTRELEINRDALQRACDERDIIIEKTAKDIKTSLVTIKGLCAVGLKDMKDPKAREYLARVDITSDNLSAILRNLFFINKSRITS